MRVSCLDRRTANKWISFFNNEAINCGQRVSVERAESFEIVRMLEENLDERSQLSSSDYFRNITRRFKEDSN